MPEFISKLQYKTYEKGEFSHEKVRNLEETLDLIKKFPWDEQRGADVQLTGPSVIIRDEYSNYIKAALYFNGKFCVYYLDCDNHLYEYHTADLNEVCSILSEFFGGQIELQKFEKRLLVVKARKHFENGFFDFTISTTKFYIRFLTLLVFFIFMLVPAILIMTVYSPLLVKVLIPFLGLVIDFLCLFSIYLLVRIYNRSKNAYLQITQGNNIFKFGNTGAITEYSKLDIAKINIYGVVSSKGSHILDIIEINFNNGDQIKFPGLLFDPFELQSKFANNKFNYIEKTAAIFKARWNY
jgi:hypothetical protein